jgi:hypothetical protein
MPQKTNLNVNPYHDDFSPDKNFYRVLFKPGYPVQSRELTTLQSILQNQIESLGNHVFKEGSIVVPGNISYDSQFYAVKVNSTHLGIDVSLYVSELVGKKIKGQNSQIEAVVRHFILEDESEEGYLTLYVNYTTGDLDFSPQPFSDGETLTIEETITYQSTIIASGETIASLVDTNATNIGSAVFIENGIYFIRGTFVQVYNDTLILEQYNNTPSYRVGLEILEELIGSKDDSSLFDNAKGFSNYAAPGADRLKITATLRKKSLTDYDDKNFLELLKVIDGKLQVIRDKTQYSQIRDYLATRTYDESGHYSVVPFEIELQNSLNDSIGSNGLYFENQLTANGNSPNEELMCVKISPGKAYVKGYDIENPNLIIIDSNKPRTTESINSSSIPFEMGNLLKVNNVTGTPAVGLNNNYYVNLQNQRKNSTLVGSGTTIGEARIYSFNPSNVVYENQATQWDLYLYDIQTYTKLTLNASLSGLAAKSSYIKGTSSNASGYLISDADSNTITLSQVSGNFIVGEKVTINGSLEITRSITTIQNYNIDDIKSVYQSVSGITGFSTSFIADTILEKRIPNNFSITDKLYINSAGIATCPGKNFIGIKSDSIIRYQSPDLAIETFNRVQSVSSDGLKLSLVGIPTVTSVCDGKVVTSTTSGVTFSLGLPSIKNEENAYLYTKLNHKNISSVDLSDSTLSIVKQVIGKTTSGSGSLTLSLSDVGITSAFFEAFDSERYSIFYNTGEIESLSSDQVTLGSGSETITFSGLKITTPVVVNTTLRKSAVTSKNKIFTRSQKLFVDKTKYKFATDFGLTYNSYYGLRIEDEEISLNVPDVVNIVGVYESLNNSNPVFDKLTFISSLNLITSAVLGEKIQGKESGAVAQIVTLVSNSDIEFVYLNSNKFIVGEEIVFSESNITGVLQQIVIGQYLNRTENYILDKGQKEQYYDYSKITRTISQEPSRKLVIIYNNYVIPSNDLGDIYTANSYQNERFSKDIPLLAFNTRCSDVLDFRPRVANFSNTTSSPFAFTSRNFQSAGINPTIVVAPNESSILGYSYYLPRIDKLILNQSGEFKLVPGNPNLNPKEPVVTEDVMEIATITLPAYLYNISDAQVSLADNRRFTMRDIGKIEDRVEKLEKTTSLSLLELNTKTLQIQDSEGLSRFKCGFFVDDFKNADLMDSENLDSRCSILAETQQLTSKIDVFTIKPKLAPSSNLNSNTIDYEADFTLLDSNVRKTGDFVTLNYTPTTWTNLQQLIATQVTNVNFYEVTEYNGFITLTPKNDTWIRDVILRRGTTRRETGSSDTSFVQNVLLSSTSEEFMRSRNVGFFATGLDPLTRHFSFLDGNKNIDIIPKLLEITMTSGQFSIGETVLGYESGQNKPSIIFRVAQQSHKKGPYNSPTSSYKSNPYNKSLQLSGYNSASTVLNIDISSMCNEVNGQFYGYVSKNMTLIGSSSKAQATISDIRLLTDTYGDLVGSFFIRDPNATPAPSVKIKTGTKVFKVSSSEIDKSLLPKGYAVSSAEESYNSVGTLRTFDEVTVIVNAIRRTDPLAQSFTTDQEGGFLSAVDLWFKEKDPNANLFVEIRSVTLGTVEGSPLADYARVELTPDEIKISNDASQATKVTFPSPIYLQPNSEYAITLISPKSKKYYVWTAKKGEKNVSLTDLPDVESVVYNTQYVGGSLFKSQNGTIWTASQEEDLKFRCYKCNFTSNEGTVYFYNPNLAESKLSQDQNVYNTVNDPITTFPRKLTVGIVTTTALSNILTSGVKVGVSDTVVGFIETVGGPISTSAGITTINTGIGYSASLTASNVSLYSITGSGSGAKANITFNASGNVSNVSIANTGTGYAVGDVLGITTSEVVKGTGARIGITSTNGIDKLYLTNVKGETFNLVSGSTVLNYYDNNGTKVSLAGTYIQSSSLVNDLYAGNVIEVYDYSHGMHSPNNLVTISNVFPTTSPSKITDSITSSSTSIVVENVGIFTTFEGNVVGASNTGYVLINNEIISYSGYNIGSNSLTGINNGRGIDESLTRNHDVGSLAYKYELNGVSLRRINKTHNMLDNSNAINSDKTLDSYYLQLNMGARSTGQDQISFNNETFVGGPNCFISQNLQFNSIFPRFRILTPSQTTVSSQVRTISATSSGGNEVSFLEQPYESIQINSENNLSSPRMIASKINETTRLSGIGTNKSLIMGISLSNSGNSNLSPAINIKNDGVLILGRNRLNKPISDYAFENGANLNVNDPHASIYITKKIDIKKPATSLKVLISSYRDSSADFRVFYRLFKSDSSEITQSYVPFPGYDNLIDTNSDGFGDKVVDLSLNNGRPDRMVRSSGLGEFLEYEFTADNLDPFNAFVIKIVMSGTNEAKSLIFEDLRIIALA